jgi:hypothetical protein
MKVPSVSSSGPSEFTSPSRMHTHCLATSTSTTTNCPGPLVVACIVFSIVHSCPLLPPLLTLQPCQAHHWPLGFVTAPPCHLPCPSLMLPTYFSRPDDFLIVVADTPGLIPNLSGNIASSCTDIAILIRHDLQGHRGWAQGRTPVNAKV